MSDTDSLLVGCCGWAGAQSLYFAQFPVIEIQTTFYQPPTIKVAAKWRLHAPPDFQFCMKAWQLITHTPSSPTYRRLREPVPAANKDLLGAFRNTPQVWLAWERTREIAAVINATVIVFQCPASFLPTPINVENFTRFFQRIGPQPCQLAWEPRGSWPPELIRELCAQHSLIHCVDPFVNQPVYGDVLYWRLHGKGGFSHRYTDENLRELQEALRLRQKGRTAYIMFNNIPMKDDAMRFLRQ